MKTLGCSQRPDCQPKTALQKSLRSCRPSPFTRRCLSSNSHRLLERSTRGHHWQLSATAQEDPKLNDKQITPQIQLNDVDQPPSAPAGTEQQQRWIWEDSDDGAAAYAAFFLWLALGSWPALQSFGAADLPYFIGLGVLTVYIGAHRGLTSKSRQQLTVKEGALAPVLASASLFGLYLLLKYFPNLSLQSLLDAYFWLLGSAAIWGAAKPLIRRVTGTLDHQASRTWQPPKGWLIDDEGNDITEVRVCPSDVLAGVFAVGLATVELSTHHSSYTLNNMVACLVATEILALVGLRSFRTAALLLVGLLAYDVFWVFGSPAVVGENVMLQVATSDVIVGPTRLLFPRSPGGVGEAADFPYSLLGLGDIAIPGMLAGLALRFDAAAAAAATVATATALAAGAASQCGADQADSSTSTSSNNSGSSGSSSNSLAAADPAPPINTSVAASATAAAAAAAALHSVSESVLQQRPYFTRVAAAHVAGLLAAFAANSITHMGQPALLYIVPATLLTVLGTAAARGDLARVWHFTDVASFGVPAVVAEKARE